MPQERGQSTRCPGDGRPTQARQMLRRLLDGRIIFTPRPDVRGVEFAGDRDLGQVFAGLVLPDALASPTCVSWNHSSRWLGAVDSLRRAA